MKARLIQALRGWEGSSCASWMLGKLPLIRLSIQKNYFPAEFDNIGELIHLPWIGSSLVLKVYHSGNELLCDNTSSTTFNVFGLHHFHARLPWILRVCLTLPECALGGVYADNVSTHALEILSEVVRMQLSLELFEKHIIHAGLHVSSQHILEKFVHYSLVGRLSLRWPIWRVWLCRRICHSRPKR